MADHSEANIRLRMDVDGNAPKSLEGMVKTTGQIDQNLQKVKQSAQAASKSIQELAYARVMELKQEREVTLAANSLMRQQGLDPTGAPLPRRQPNLGPTAGQAFRTVAGGALQAGGMGSVSSLIGGAGAAPYVAAAMAMVYAFEKGIAKVANAMEVRSQVFLSESRRRVATAESLDPTGILGGIRKGVEADIYHPLRNQREIKYGVRKAGMQAQGQAWRQAGGLFFDSEQARFQAEATRAIGYAPLQRIDRSTMQGEVAYAEMQKRLPAQDEQVRADRAAMAARQADTEQQRKIDEMQGGVKIARERLAASGKFIDLLRQQEDAGSGVRSRLTGKELPGINQGILGHAFSKANINQALHDRELQSVDLQNKLNQLEDEKNRKKQTGLALAEAEHQKRQATLNQSRAELDILQQREQRMSQQAQRLGLMNKGQRIQGLAAARFIKQFGMGQATPDIIAAAQQFAPDYVRKQAEAFGEQTAEGRAGRAEGFLFDQGNLQQLRAQIDKVQANVRVDISLDEEKLADNIAGVLQRVFINFLKDIDTKIEKAMSDTRAGKLQERND